MLAKILIVGAIPLALTYGDFQYQSTSRMTGGSLLTMLKFVPGSGAIKEPQVSTVAFKGNRMVRRNKRQAEIIDLDKRTITTVDFDKKQWSEVTFDQMKQALEDASQQLKEKQADNGQQVNLAIDADVKDTGQTKTVNGLDAHQVLLTMTTTMTDPQSGQSGAMKMNSEMWIAKDVPGSSEMRDFYKRMAKELDWLPSGLGGMMNRPDMSKAVAKMMAEGSKMEGTTVEQIIRIGGSGDTAAMAASQSQSSSSSSSANSSSGSSKGSSVSSALGSALGSKLGGLGGFGKKKSDAPSSSDSSSTSNTAAAPASASTSLMEMTVDDSGFSTGSVDESLFAFPSTFKKVESDALAPSRRK
jgi:hypothetical protein